MSYYPGFIRCQKWMETLDAYSHPDLDVQDLSDDKACYVSIVNKTRANHPHHAGAIILTRYEMEGDIPLKPQSVKKWMKNLNRCKCHVGDLHDYGEVIHSHFSCQTGPKLICGTKKVLEAP